MSKEAGTSVLRMARIGEQGTVGGWMRVLVGVLVRSVRGCVGLRFGR